MDTKQYTLFATILDDWNDKKKRLDYDALSKDYSQSFPITTNSVSEAIKVFQESRVYYDFSVTHVNTNVYTYVKAEGETIYQRADKIPSAIGADD